MKIPLSKHRFHKFARFIFLSGLGLIILSQAALIFPLWKLPHWRFQALFGSVWEGHYWPWIPYSLYDQPIPKFRDEKFKYSLWIQPTFLNPRKLREKDIGRKITRFQLNSILESLVQHHPGPDRLSELKLFLESQTGYSIVSSWIEKERWIFFDQKWKEDSHEKFIQLW